MKKTEPIQRRKGAMRRKRARKAKWAAERRGWRDRRNAADQRDQRLLNLYYDEVREEQRAWNMLNFELYR